MDNNYKKALEKITKAQKEFKCFNCCYPLINQTNLIGPTGPQGPTGPEGKIGPTGPQGVQGVQGIQGLPGPQGMQGEIGPTGPSGTSVTIMGSYANLDELLKEHSTGNLGDSYLVGSDLYVWSNNGGKWVNVGKIRGPQGEIGPTGPIGEPGPQGIQGVEGLQGIPGPQGEIGPTGPRGPEGPIGPSGYALLSAYGGKFNNMQTMIDTLGSGNWIQIPLTDNLESINIIDTTPNVIELEQDGIYEINYSLNITASISTTLTLIVRENSEMITSTVISKQINPLINTSFNGSTIVKLNANDKLDMALSATNDNVMLTFGSGVTALLTIKKLDEID